MDQCSTTYNRWFNSAVLKLYLTFVNDREYERSVSEIITTKRLITRTILTGANIGAIASFVCSLLSFALTIPVYNINGQGN